MADWGNTPSTAQSCTTINIEFKDAERANETITVHVCRNDNEPADDIEIQLDANGCGSEEYDVPSGPTSIEFTASGVPSHVMGVTTPPV